MRANRLGCLTGTGLFAALITALFIAGFAVASGGKMFSPGDLNAVTGKVLGGVTSHAQIAGACSACHVAPWEKETMDDRCIVCHTDVPVQMRDIMTAHGRMYAIDPSAKCRDCHTEHHGPTAILTDIEGWKYPHELSGFSLTAHQFKSEKDPFQCVDCHGTDVTTFDVKTCTNCHDQRDQAFTTQHIIAYGDSCLNCHEGTDRLGKNFTHVNFTFPLTGKHLQVACENCHTNTHQFADFKSAPPECNSCHTKDDPHGGSLGPDCASCHSPEGWKPAHFDHNLADFKLTDAHLNVACEKCHIDNMFKGTPKDCFSCHKQNDPHKGVLGQQCDSCHKPTDWHDVTFDHSKARLALLGKHASVACASCHKDNLFKGTPQNCASCHADVHSGQMGNDCASCHNPQDWKDVHFDHSTTGFPLSGNHASVSCKSCHVNNVYKGTPKNCFACHAAKDVHNGQFGTDCGSCHNPSGWKNVSFDHKKTGFPLTGSHVGVQCSACHVNNIFKGTPTNCFACHASKDAHSGQFGTACESCHKPTTWQDVVFDHNKTAFPLSGRHTNVQCKSCHTNGVYKGTPTDCYSCHAAKDAHNGQFGTVCSNCHNTSGWQNVTFDHNKTAFPLVSSHTNVACKSCHVNNVFKGTPKDCYSCHASKDAHNGQFGTNCGSCHRPTTWQDVTFNHNNTSFPLTGKHISVNCQSCHSNGVYKGTPTNCYACHASNDAHNGQFGTDCGSCHNTSGWSNVTFDHNKTAFPLIGHHAQLSCSKCHGNGVYKGTPTECIACHQDEHNGENGTDCSICHTPNGWGDIIKP